VAWVVYLLCALTAALCAVLLMRSYTQTKYRLLLWSGLCFAGLTLNNILLVLDKLVIASMDLSVWRSSVALAAMCILLYGLIWEAE